MAQQIRVTVTLTDQIKRQLVALQKKLHRNASDVVRHAILQMFVRETARGRRPE
jgi:Arc/MetJ-type ribon-helix-helix transcriptional regulator